MTVNYEKEPLEIMEGTIVFALPNDATKETIRIQYLGQQKVMTWNEYTEAVRKAGKKKAKSKLVEQLKNLPSKTETEPVKTLTAEQIESAIDAREAETEISNGSNQE